MATSSTLSSPEPSLCLCTRPRTRWRRPSTSSHLARHARPPLVLATWCGAMVSVTQSQVHVCLCAARAQRWLMVPLSVWLIGVVAGDSFGELALSDPKCIRKATVVTDEPTDLLVLGKVLVRIRAAQCHKRASKPPNLLSTPTGRIHFHRGTHPQCRVCGSQNLPSQRPSAGCPL